MLAQKGEKALEKKMKVETPLSASLHMLAVGVSGRT